MPELPVAFILGMWVGILIGGIGVGAGRGHSAPRVGHVPDVPPGNNIPTGPFEFVRLCRAAVAVAEEWEK